MEYIKSFSVQMGEITGIDSEYIKLTILTVLVFLIFGIIKLVIKKIYSKNVKTRILTNGVRVNVESVVHGTTIIPLYTTTRLRMEYKDGVQRVV